MKTLKQQIKIMQAFDAGENIEYMVLFTGDPSEHDIWEPCPIDESFNWDSCNYRVKPISELEKCQEDLLKFVRDLHNGAPPGSTAVEQALFRQAMTIIDYIKRTKK